MAIFAVSSTSCIMVGRGNAPSYKGEMASPCGSVPASSGASSPSSSTAAERATRRSMRAPCVLASSLSTA